MTLKVENYINGCPQFQSNEPIMGRSLLTENRTIKALKPSDQTHNRVLLCIQRLFYRVLNWLYPFEKTPYVGIVNALDTHTAAFEDMQTDELCTYFKRFFHAEKSVALQTCVEELQTQYQVIAQLQTVSQSRTPAGVVYNSKDSAKFQAAQKKIHDKVVQLKQGEQSLVVYNSKGGNELFFLFSKEQGQTHLKVIGRGEALFQLSDIREATIAGQAQIVASIDYGAVSDGLIQQLLALTPINEPSSLPLSQIKELLNPLRSQSSSLPDFTTAPKNGLRFLQNVFSQVEKNRGQSAEDIERMHTRFELFTLFSYLKEVRKQWTASADDMYALQRMLHICSSHLFTAHRSQIISQAERDALVQELTEVQKSLDQMVSNANKRIEPMNMPSMDVFKLDEAEMLTAAQDVETPTLVPIKQARAPRTLPQTSSSPGLDRTPIEKEALAGTSIPEQLQALTHNATAQQIVRTLFAIPFTPFSGDYHHHVDKQGVWSRFSRQEAESLMRDLVTLSKQLADFCIQEKTTPIDVYEALMKMTAMITFLTYYQIEGEHPSLECRRLLHDVSGFMVEVSGTSCVQRERFGHALHAENVKTSQELHAFYWNINRLGDLARSYEKHTSVIVERLGPLQKQVELLFYLTPHHPDRMDTSGAISVMVHHWIAPLPLSLLASYLRLTMQQSVSTSSRYDPQAKKAEKV